MLNCRRYRLFFYLFAFFCFLSRLDAEQYKIRNIYYEIDGRTREYPLEKNLDIEKRNIYNSKKDFEAYVKDLEVKLLNQRVLQSGEISVSYGEKDEDGIIPADLLIKASDTFNYVLVPFPKFDSNDGLNLKLKFKDYNFFGSMNTLNADIDYEYDPYDDTAHTVGGNLSFTIPFKLFEQEFTWSVDTSVYFPIGEPVDIDFSTTLAYERELIPFRLEMNAGITQAAYVYPRDDHEELYSDPYYLSNTLYINFPLIIYTHSYIGDLTWTPQLAFTGRWAFGSLTDDDLRGASITFSHYASFGRYDWVENYRKGFSLSASNSFSYNPITTKKEIAVAFSAIGYMPIFSFLGVYSRGYFMYDWESDGDLQVDMGSYMRGIIDERIETDMAFFFNIDLPIKILDIDFERTTGVGWTKFINLEAHLSPFFDFGLTHDQYTGRYFSFKDAWYSGGIEVIVFPDKLRSVYARASLGFDLKELFTNGFDFTASAKREGGGSIMEIFIGVGLEY